MRISVRAAASTRANPPLLASAAGVPLRQFFTGTSVRDSIATTKYASKFLPEAFRKSIEEQQNEQIKLRMFPPHVRMREEGKDKKFYTQPHEFKERYYEEYLAAEKRLAERRAARETRQVADDPVDSETAALSVAAVEDVPVGPPIYALAARIGLVTRDIKHVAQVLYRTREGSRFTCLGYSALGLYVLEYFHMRYPLLPDGVLSRIIHAYIGNEALTALGYDWGLHHVGKFDFLTDLMKPEEREVDSKDMAEVVRGLVGVIAAHDAKATRVFIHAHILSRLLDIKNLVQFEYPINHLVKLTRRQQKEPPTFRLLKESGRRTHCPIFVVGVFSGLEKLAEGYGSSLPMAKFRAARTALRDYYTTEVKDIQLPSDTLFEAGIGYVAQPVGDTPAHWKF